MQRPKNLLFPVLLLSVVAVVLAVAIHAARQPRPVGPAPSAAAGYQPPSPAFVSHPVPPDGTPSAAAQKRAKDFNDATNRFNAPDDPPR